MRILIADDDVTSRMVLASVLTKAGYEVVEAINGAQAWQVLKEPGAPRLVVLDWLMPEMEGLEVIRKVRTLPGEAPPYIIMLTSRGDKRDIIAGLEAGANDYLAKPFDSGELQARVEVGRRMVEMQGSLIELSQELHLANAELQELNELKNRFLGMAAHDLRRPVGVIMAYGDSVLDEAGDRLSGEQAGFLRTILAAATGMKRLIDNFLDVSVIESGRLKLERERTDGAEVLSGVLPLVRLPAARKGVELLTEGAADRHPFTADVAKLQQAIANLAINAVEHSEAGHRVWLAARREGSEVVFSVRDEGPGIAPEEHGRLFAPFASAGTRKTAGERSVGLGLAIARQVVQAHGGRIWVESEPTHGAAFFVALRTGGDAVGSLNLNECTVGGEPDRDAGPAHRTRRGL